jgi:hypothetical protein
MSHYATDIMRAADSNVTPRNRSLELSVSHLVSLTLK